MGWIGWRKQLGSALNAQPAHDNMTTKAPETAHDERMPFHRISCSVWLLPSSYRLGSFFSSLPSALGFCIGPGIDPGL